ncbi:unnamed protein product [Caenorhabditis brenneri]
MILRHFARTYSNLLHRIILLFLNWNNRNYLCYQSTCNSNNLRQSLLLLARVLSSSARKENSLRIYDNI